MVVTIMSYNRVGEVEAALGDSLLHYRQSVLTKSLAEAGESIDGFGVGAAVKGYSERVAALASKVEYTALSEFIAVLGRNMLGYSMDPDATDGMDRYSVNSWLEDAVQTVVTGALIPVTIVNTEEEYSDDSAPKIAAEAAAVVRHLIAAGVIVASAQLPFGPKRRAAPKQAPKRKTSARKTSPKRAPKRAPKRKTPKRKVSANKRKSSGRRR